jgi:predicted nuclease of predicted toxin-antitoxin system
VPALRLYLDEDVQVFIADALRLRGYEATTTRDQGRLGADDIDQLTFIQQHSYTLLTYNVNDFPRLHYQWLAARKHHPGIIIASRENPSQNIRALLNLLALVSAEEMADQLEYLNFWI